MDELDRLLAETMRDAAQGAPSDNGLLSTVHRRSDTYRRRRIVTTAAAAVAVLAIGVPVAVTLAGSDQRSAPPVAAPSPTSSVTLADGYQAPAFPYTLPATDGMKSPVASMKDGDLIAFFEAREIKHHSDVTVTVSSREPSFSGTAITRTVTVRGHRGSLRTVDVQPAKQITLTWPESSGRWISLATDDTYSNSQVVALADALKDGSVAVLPPFRLDLSPAGFVTETVTESTMTFRAPTGSGTIQVVLRKRRTLTGATVKVGSYRAAFDQAGVLSVDVTDWNATLEVTVGSGLGMSRADMVRFAAGIHVLNRSNPR